MQICLGKHCSNSSFQYKAPAHSTTHTHTFPRLSDLHALSFEWHKYLSSLGFCTQPEHTYIASDGDAGRSHCHPSDLTGNVYQLPQLTSARIKASIKKMSNTNRGEVTSDRSCAIKAHSWLAAFLLVSMLRRGWLGGWRMLDAKARWATESAVSVLWSNLLPIMHPASLMKRQGPIRHRQLW